MSENGAFLEFLDEVEVVGEEIPETESFELFVAPEVVVTELEVSEYFEFDDGRGPAGPPDASGLAYIRHDGVEYAERSTVTNDPLRPVVWIGPVEPSIGAPFAQDDVDIFWLTT